MKLLNRSKKSDETTTKKEDGKVRKSLFGRRKHKSKDEGDVAATGSTASKDVEQKTSEVAVSPVTSEVKSQVLNNEPSIGVKSSDSKADGSMQVGASMSETKTDPPQTSEQDVPDQRDEAAESPRSEPKLPDSPKEDKTEKEAPADTADASKAEEERDEDNENETDNNNETSEDAPAAEERDEDVAEDEPVAEPEKKEEPEPAVASETENDVAEEEEITEKRESPVEEEVEPATGLLCGCL